MGILHFAKGNLKFQNVRFQENKKKYIQLINDAHHPKALFIGCSNSRVLPEMI